MLTAKFVAARVDNFLKGMRGLELGSLVPTWNIRESRTPTANKIAVNTCRAMDVEINEKKISSPTENIILASKRVNSILYSDIVVALETGSMAELFSILRLSDHE